MTEGLETLTDKEKETLRLVVRGHDAKSMARALRLSVHTVNERLRVARRKLSVTSSREAARLLFDSEGAHPKNHADKDLGSALGEKTRNRFQLPNGRRGDDQGTGRRTAWLIGGLITISLALALFLVSSPFAVVGGPGAHDSRPDVVAAEDAALEAAARNWLTLVDASDWRASYEATGGAFRELNTEGAWQSASEQARVPLGQVAKREATGFENVNAPPNGHSLVRFRSDFAGRKGVVETVMLERENGTLKVVGYSID